MERKFSNSSLISDQEEYDNTTESGPESPPSSLLINDMKMTSTSFPKKSKRGIQKRVVSVPIKDAEGSRLKGENATPPSDSWAWRKYGQKPIKGSPYPRGYYRCSSSKGCPARKQVERSKMDPTMLVVTYSCEHNHPWPLPSRNHHHHHNQSNSSPKVSTDPKPEVTTPREPENPEPEPEPELEEKFADLGSDEFGWFGGMETTPSTILESPIFSETARSAADADMSLFFTMREEDESLFADLGELPECTAVFRPHRGVGPQVQIC